MAIMEGGDCLCPCCGGMTPFQFDITGESRAFTECCSACGRLVVCDLMRYFNGAVSIGYLTVEALRSAVQQHEDLGYWLRRALDVLREHPMAEGDLHEGDLLSAVLTRDPEVWSALPELARDLRAIVSGLVDPPPQIRREAERFLAFN